MFKDGGEVCVREGWVKVTKCMWVGFGNPLLGGGATVVCGEGLEWGCVEWNKGHKDFSNDGENCFDYTLEDHDPATSPWPPRWAWPPVKPKTHFQPNYQSMNEVKAAVEECDVDGFQRAAHRLQDYYTHWKKGYRKGWHPPVDSIDADNNAWDDAEIATKWILDKWKENCCLKECGKKCDYVKRSEGPCK